MYMDFTFILIWMLGFTFYMNEMIVNFKGHHAEKIRMTYKSEGYGLHTDAIFFKKDTHTKYLCEIILCQKHIDLKGCCHLILE